MGTVSTRQFAVITGASSGIGLELARVCVENNFDLLICAQHQEDLLLAQEHLSKGGAQVSICACDLATRDGCETLVRAVHDSGRSIDALMLNAGIGVSGAFLDNDLDDELRAIALNVNAVVILSKNLIPAMVERGQGRVLITASVASTSPAPFLAIYGATKAFDLSFSEALRFELKDTGVTVTALQPGATETEFFATADMGDTKVAERKKDDPADVARKGFEAMMAGKDKVIAANLKSKIEGWMGELLPEPLKARMQASQTKPGTAKH